MKTILLFGAGKSATVLIDFLKQLATDNSYNVIVADNDLQSAQSKVGNHPLAKALAINIHDEEERRKLIQKTDIIISFNAPGTSLFNSCGLR